MRAFKLAALALASGCTQLGGIHELPDDGIPAVSGTYAMAIDFRPNTAIGSVIVFIGTVSLDRISGAASLMIQPVTASTHLATGDATSSSISVHAGPSITYTSEKIGADVGTSANPNSAAFSFTGSLAGVFKDENDFCGVVTGTYVLNGVTSSLPSVSLGAQKNAPPSGPLTFDCAGDVFNP